MMTDPISDMLARIRNASLARQGRTEIPLSNLKTRIAGILKDEGFISDFSVDDAGHGKIVVILKYAKGYSSAIAGMKRHSRPGRRVYVGYRDIPRIHNGLGVAIMSTSRGIMATTRRRASISPVRVRTRTPASLHCTECTGSPVRTTPPRRSARASDTAWAPPEPVIERLREMLDEMFPSEDGYETNVAGSWVEEGYQSAGVF